MGDDSTYLSGVVIRFACPPLEEAGFETSVPPSHKRSMIRRVRSSNRIPSLRRTDLRMVVFTGLLAACARRQPVPAAGRRGQGRV